MPTFTPIPALFLTLLLSAPQPPAPVSQPPNPPAQFTIPTTWTRQGLVLPRQGDPDGSGWGVSGDPCIVWDPDIRGWRMVLFHDPPGHAQAVCMNPDNLGPGQW